MQIKCKRRLPVVLSVTLLAAVLSACGVKAPPVQTGMPVQTPDSGNVTITKTKAKATETELYSAPDGSFSMQIPAETDGCANTGARVNRYAWLLPAA